MSLVAKRPQSVKAGMDARVPALNRKGGRDSATTVNPPQSSKQRIQEGSRQALRQWELHSNIY